MMAEWKTRWKQAQAVLERHNGDDGPGTFLNLGDGDRVKVVFLDDEPYARERRWDNLDRCSKFDQDITDANEKLPSGEPRYSGLRATISFNVYDVEKKIVRVFEANATTARLLFSAFDMMDGPSKAVMELSRQGAGKDTTYSIRKDKNLPEAAQEKMRKILMSDGHDLAEMQGPPGGPSTHRVPDAAVAASDSFGRANGAEPPVQAPGPTDDFDLF